MKNIFCFFVLISMTVVGYAQQFNGDWLGDFTSESTPQITKNRIFTLKGTNAHKNGYHQQFHPYKKKS